MSFTEWWNSLAVPNKVFGIAAVAIFVIALLCLIIGLFVSKDKYKRTSKIVNEQDKKQGKEKANGKLQEQIERIKEEIKNIKNTKQPEVKPSKDYTNDFADLKVQNAEIKTKYDLLASEVRNQQQNPQIFNNSDIQDLKRQLDDTNKKLEEQEKSLSELKQKPKEVNQDTQKQADANKNPNEQQKDLNIKDNQQQPVQPGQQTMNGYYPPMWNYQPLAPMGGYYQPNGYPAPPAMNPMMNPTMNPMMHPMMNPMMHPMMNPIMNPMMNPMMHPMMNPMMNPMMHPMMNPMFAGGYMPQFCPQMGGNMPVPGTWTFNPIQPAVAPAQPVSERVIREVPAERVVVKPSSDLDRPYVSWSAREPFHGSYGPAPYAGPQYFPNNNESTTQAINLSKDSLAQQINSLKDNMEKQKNEQDAKIDEIWKNIKDLYNPDNGLNGANNNFNPLKRNPRFFNVENNNNAGYDPEQIVGKNNNFDPDGLRRLGGNDNKFDDVLNDLLKKNKDDLGDDNNGGKKPFNPDILDQVGEKFDQISEKYEPITKPTEKKIKAKAFNNNAVVVFTVEEANPFIAEIQALQKIESELIKEASQCLQAQGGGPVFANNDDKKEYNDLRNSIKEAIESAKASIQCIYDELSPEEQQNLKNALDAAGITVDGINLDALGNDGGDDDGEQPPEQNGIVTMDNYKEYVYEIAWVVYDLDQPIDKRQTTVTLSRVKCNSFLEKYIKPILAALNTKELREAIEQEFSNHNITFNENLITQLAGQLGAVVNNPNRLTQIKMKQRLAQIIINQLQDEKQQQWVQQVQQAGKRHPWFDEKSGIRAVINEIRALDQAIAFPLEMKWRKVLEDLGLTEKGEPLHLGQGGPGGNQPEQGGQDLDTALSKAEKTIKGIDKFLQDNETINWGDNYKNMTLRIKNLKNELDNVRPNDNDDLAKISECKDKLLEKQIEISKRILSETKSELNNNADKDIADRMLDLFDRIKNLKERAKNMHDSLTKQLFVNEAEQIKKELEALKQEVDDNTTLRNQWGDLHNQLVMARLGGQDLVGQVLGGARIEEGNRLLRSTEKCQNLLNRPQQQGQITDNEIKNIEQDIAETYEDLLTDNGKQWYQELQGYLTQLKQKYSQQEIGKLANRNVRITAAKRTGPFTKFCERYKYHQNMLKQALDSDHHQDISNDVITMFALQAEYTKQFEDKHDEVAKAAVKHAWKNTICNLVYGCDCNELFMPHEKKTIENIYLTIDAFSHNKEPQATLKIIETINEAHREHNPNGKAMKIRTENINNDFNIGTVRKNISSLFSSKDLDPKDYPKVDFFVAEEKFDAGNGAKVPAVRLMKFDGDGDTSPLYLCYEQPDQPQGQGQQQGQGQPQEQGKIWLHWKGDNYAVNKIHFNKNNNVFLVSYADLDGTIKDIPMKIDIRRDLQNLTLKALIKAKSMNAQGTIAPDRFYRDVIENLLQQQNEQTQYYVDVNKGGVFIFSPLPLIGNNQMVQPARLTLDPNDDPIKLNGQQVIEIWYLPHKQSLAIL